MPAADRIDERAGHQDRRMAHGKRLRLLREEAAKIRRRHEAGELSAYEAGRELDALKRRYVRFVDRLIDA